MVLVLVVFLLTIPFVALLEMYGASSLKLLELLLSTGQTISTPFRYSHIAFRGDIKKKAVAAVFFLPNVLTRVLLWSDMDIAMRKESSTDVLLLYLRYCNTQKRRLCLS